VKIPSVTVKFVNSFNNNIIRIQKKFLFFKTSIF